MEFKYQLTSRLSKTFGFTILTGLLASCAHIIPLTPDDKWHTVYSLQAPSKSIELEIEAVNASRDGCNRDRTPEQTQIRIIQLESFQRLDALPETIEDTQPREDGIPIRQADSGPYDLTLLGAKRHVSLITGKQIIVRTRDRCTSLEVIDRTPKQ